MVSVSLKVLLVWVLNIGYSGPRLIRPPLGNENYGLNRGVASCEGYIRYNYTEFASWNCGLIRGVASDEVGHIQGDHCTDRALCAILK